MSTFSLSSIIDRLDPQILLQLSAGGKKSRGEIYQDLVDLPRVQQAADSLTARERQSLLLFLKEERPARQQMSRLPQGDTLMKKLGEAYIVFTLRDTFNRQMIPLDYYPALLDLLVHPQPQLAGPDRTERRQPSNGFEAILPLYHLLSEARREPLPQTNSGQIYRRTIGKLRKTLPASVSAEKIDSAVNLGYYYRLLALSPDGSLVTTMEAESFFSHTMPEMLSRVLQWSLERAPLFLIFIVSLAALLEPDQWLDTAAVLKWGKELKLPGAYDSYTLSYSLEGLGAAGIWETRGQSSGRLTDPYYYGWARRQLVPQSAQAVLIEPTGDVLAPPHTLLSTLWDLDAMANLVKYDQMTVYHIDRSSIAHAVLGQWDRDTCLAALDQMSRVPVPSNLRQNIEDWFKQLTRHRMLRATILHSADARDSAEAEKILHEHIRARLSPTDLIVSHENPKQLFKVMEHYGVPVIPRIEDYDDGEGDGPTQKSPWDEVAPPLRRGLAGAVSLGSRIAVRTRAPGAKTATVRLLPLRLDQGTLDGVSDQGEAVSLPLHDIQDFEVER